MGTFRRCVGFVLGAMAVCLLTFAQAAEFRGVTHKRISLWEVPVSVTANGRVLVGGIPTNAPSTIEAFRLDADTWTNTILTNSTSGSEQIYAPWSRSFGASADGSTVLIQSYLDNHCVINDCHTQEYYGYRWKGGTLTSLPWLSGHDQAWPMDVTADGSTAAGWSYERAHTFIGPYNYYRNAVTWNTSTGAITDLGKYGGDADAWAVEVSEDGSVIIGQSGLIREDPTETWWRPVLWRSAINGWSALERIHTGSSATYFQHRGNIAHGLSNDGKIGVGNLYDGSTHVHPVFWDLKPTSPTFGDYTTLPLLAGDIYESGRALTVSKNIQGRGYVIGGYVSDDPYWITLAFYDFTHADAVLWETDSLNFPTKVETILLGLGLENAIKGWKLETVTSISDDAKVITGTGIHPNGQRWNWYADMRNPQPNETRAKSQYIGQSAGNLFTGRAKVGGDTSDASPSITPVQNEMSKLRPTLWYSYSAPMDGYLSLDLAGSITFSLLAVYRENETVPMAHTYTCSDPNSVGPCFIPDELKIDADTMYYISVSGMEVPQGEESFELHHQFTPISDNCSKSFYLSQSLPTAVKSSTNSAVAATGPTCSTVDVTSPGVWFKVVGTGGMMTASMDGAADYDTKLTVYCADCGPSPACIAANDDINGQLNQASEVEWCSNSGTVYNVLVHGYGIATGNFTLSVSSTPASCFAYNCPVANTSCSSPVPIEDEGTTILADNSNAGTNTSTTLCGGVNNDVWFDYTAKCDGQVVIDTCQPQGSLADTVLALYDSCGGTELSCNDNSIQGDCNGERSAIFYDADPGQQLTIMAANYGAAEETGSFPLRVQELPANVNIQELMLQDVTQSDNISIQLPISGGCPKTSTGYFANTGSTSLPPGLELSRSGLLSGTASVSGSYSFEVFVTDGEILLPNRSDSAVYSLTVRPANDSCATAQSVNEGLTLFGNVGATDQTQPPPQCGGENYSSDVWFTYSSACSGVATASTCGSSFDTTLALYTGSSCPASGAADQCSTDEVSCGAASKQSELVFDVEKGKKYFLRVGSSNVSGGVEGSGELLITCFDDCNANAKSDLSDISSGTSKDADSNGIPDECEKRDFPWPLFLPAIHKGGNK